MVPQSDSNRFRRARQSVETPSEMGINLCGSTQIDLFLQKMCPNVPKVNARSVGDAEPVRGQCRRVVTVDLDQRPPAGDLDRMPLRPRQTNSTPVAIRPTQIAFGAGQCFRARYFADFNVRF